MTLLGSRNVPSADSSPCCMHDLRLYHPLTCSLALKLYVYQDYMWFLVVLVLLPFLSPSLPCHLQGEAEGWEPSSENSLGRRTCASSCWGWMPQGRPVSTCCGERSSGMRVGVESGLECVCVSVCMCQCVRVSV